MEKLQKRVTLSLLLFSIVATVSLSGFSTVFVLNAFKENTEQYLKAQAESYGHELNEVLVGIESTVSTLEHSMAGIIDSEKIFSRDHYASLSKMADKILSDFDENNIQATSIYIRFDPKYADARAGAFHSDIDGDGVLERLEPTNLEEYTEADREHVAWYYEPLAYGKGLWIKPYYNANVNAYMVSYAMPLKVDGRSIGVVGIDINFDQLSEVVNRQMDTGQGMLLDQSDAFLVHPRYKMGEKLEAIDGGKLAYIKDILAKEPVGVIEYQLEGLDKVLGYTRLKNDWTMIVAMSQKEAFMSLNSNLMMLVIINLGISGLIILAGVWLSTRFNKLFIRNNALEEMVAMRTLELQGTNGYLEETVAELENQQAEMTLINERLEDSLKALKHTQDKLIIKEKLASLGELIAGIAHELNTPVGIAITLNSYLEKQTKALKLKYDEGRLSKGDMDRFFESIEETLPTSEKTLNRVAKLIEVFKQTLLEGSLLEVHSVELKSFFETAVEDYQYKIQGQGHTLQIISDESVKAYIYPMVWQQILYQLINNSLIHGFEDQMKGNIEIRIIKEANKIQWIYRDNGKGISEEIKEKVMHPFFSTRKHKGSAGLGLHIVHNLVTQTLGGSLQILSQEGQGVEITIECFDLEP